MINEVEKYPGEIKELKNKIRTYENRVLESRLALRRVVDGFDNQLAISTEVALKIALSAINYIENGVFEND